MKNFQIGNAVINDETDTLGMYDYFGSHALISYEAIQKIRESCDFSPNTTTQSEACNSVDGQINKALSYINIYSIYAPSCFSTNTTAKPKRASVSIRKIIRITHARLP